MPLLGALPDVDVAGAELQRRRHRLLLVGGAGAGQVEVYAVRPHLLRAARDEPKAELRVVAGQNRTIDVLDDLSAEHTGPELRDTSRVVRRRRSPPADGRAPPHAKRRPLTDRRLWCRALKVKILR